MLDLIRRAGQLQFGNQICEWPFFSFSDDGRHRYWSSIKERDFYRFMEDRYIMRDKQLSSTKFGAIINYDWEDSSPFWKKHRRGEPLPGGWHPMARRVS